MTNSLPSHLQGDFWFRLSSSPQCRALGFDNCQKGVEMRWRENRKIYIMAKAAEEKRGITLAISLPGAPTSWLLRPHRIKSKLCTCIEIPMVAWKSRSPSPGALWSSPALCCLQSTSNLAGMSRSDRYSELKYLGWREGLDIRVTSARVIDLGKVTKTQAHLPSHKHGVSPSIL